MSTASKLNTVKVGEYDVSLNHCLNWAGMVYRHLFGRLEHSAMDPSRGTYSTPPDPLAGWEETGGGR